jgi:hypothetical protein
VILRALPAAWRRHTAVAAAADYFYRVSWLAHAVSLVFNTVPVQRKGEGPVGDAASDLSRLIDEGWSLLVFAEGTRWRDGTIGRLHSGAAVLAAEDGRHGAGPPVLRGIGRRHDAGQADRDSHRVFRVTALRWMAVARIFVTGASGFIGGALAARLLERGDEVVGLARSDEAAAVVARRGAEVARGELRVFVDTYVSVVDIADTVKGRLLAAARGRSGQRYVLNGATIPSGEALRIVSELSGISEPVHMVPPALARAVATLAEAVARARGKTSSICRARVRTILHGHRYDGSRATRELGLSYTPVAETFRRTIEWAVAEGLVTRPLPRG